MPVYSYEPGLALTNLDDRLYILDFGCAVCILHGCKGRAGCIGCAVCILHGCKGCAGCIGCVALVVKAVLVASLYTAWL